MTVASGAILQPLVGLALDLSWDGTIMDGARHCGRRLPHGVSAGAGLAVIGLLAVPHREAPLEDGRYKRGHGTFRDFVISNGGPWAPYYLWIIGILATGRCPMPALRDDIDPDGLLEYCCFPTVR